MQTNIEKQGGLWKVTFTHGCQTFTLNHTGTKKELKWYKAMLDECFKRAFSEKHKCNCIDELKHGETSVMCCNECGLPTEQFWTNLDSEFMEASNELLQRKVNNKPGKKRNYKNT